MTCWNFEAWTTVRAKHSGRVGDDLFDILEDRSTDSCSSKLRVYNGEWYLHGGDASGWHSQHRQLRPLNLFISSLTSAALKTWPQN